MEMGTRVAELRASGVNILSLLAGEPDFPTPDHIVTAAKQAMDEGYTRYTPAVGIPQLREAVTVKLKRDNNVEVKPDQVIVSNGSKHSLFNACLTLFQQGDEAQLFAFLRERAESTQTVRAYLRLARYSVEMKDPDSANVALETAIALDGGQSVEPYLAAADLAADLGDPEMAVYRLRQAFGIAPHDERISDRLRALGEVPGPTIALPPGRDIIYEP